MTTYPSFKTSTHLLPNFDADVRNVHLIYDYDAESPECEQIDLWRITCADLVGGRTREMEI